MDAGTAPAIVARGLSRAYGDHEVLRDVSFDLPAGRTLAVVGPNGAGKTTLLRMLATLLRPGGGELEVFGCELPRQAWGVRSRIGFLGHEPLLYEELTVIEALGFHARLHGLGDDWRGRARDLLEAAGMARFADEYAGNLSAGMAQRVATCRALLHDPELLLLDEPLANLDEKGATALSQLIGPREGRTRVLVTHDRKTAYEESDHVLTLDHRGRAEVTEGGAERSSGGWHGRGGPAGEQYRWRSQVGGSPPVTGPAGRSSGPPAEQNNVSFRTAFRTILSKDLRIELRTLQSLPAMALFAITTFVIFRYALDRTRLEGDLAAGVISVTLLFAGILAINRVFLAEREQGGFDAIRLAPIDAGALLAAKAAALVTYLFVLELVAVPIFAIFFLDEWGGVPGLLGVLILLDLGLAVIGSLVSTIATNSRARDLLVPLILLPLVVPLMIATAGAAEPLLAPDGPETDRLGTWLAVLGLYDLVFGLIAYAVYDYLLED